MFERLILEIFKFLVEFINEREILCLLFHRILFDTLQITSGDFVLIYIL